MTLCRRLEDFLASLETEVYPEPLAEPHASVTRTIVHSLVHSGFLPEAARILDVGCGQGWALQLFTKLGYRPVGITLGPDYEVCKAAGHEVLAQNIHDLDFPDRSFDFVFCRHALEHSIYPLFTLHEMRRILVPRGHLYVEVPAPDTACHHEKNPNHYSMLGRSAWIALLDKAGFDLVRPIEIGVTVPDGPDLYLGFVARSRS